MESSIRNSGAALSMSQLCQNSENVCNGNIGGYKKGKGKGHPCTGTEALYKPYGLQEE